MIFSNGRLVGATRHPTASADRLQEGRRAPRKKIPYEEVA